MNFSVLVLYFNAAAYELATVSTEAASTFQLQKNEGDRTGWRQLDHAWPVIH